MARFTMVMCLNERDLRLEQRLRLLLTTGQWAIPTPICISFRWSRNCAYHWRLKGIVRIRATRNFCTEAFGNSASRGAAISTWCINAAFLDSECAFEPTSQDGSNYVSQISCYYARGRKDTKINYYELEQIDASKILDGLQFDDWCYSWDFFILR